MQQSRHRIESPLTICREKIHDYLGMTLDFSIDGKVQIRMEDYIRTMLAALPEEMAGMAATPAADHLDRIPSTTPGAEPPRDARNSGSARSHSTHLETSSTNQP